MQLWSEDFNGANDMLDNGGGGDSGNYLLQELHGTPSDRGLVQNEHPRRMVRPPTGRDAHPHPPLPRLREDVPRSGGLREHRPVSLLRRFGRLRPAHHLSPLAGLILRPLLRHPGRAQHLTVQRTVKLPEHAKRAQGEPRAAGTRRIPCGASRGAFRWRRMGSFASPPCGAALRMTT